MERLRLFLMSRSASVRIIVDSSMDIADRFFGRVEVVPLTVMFGDEEFSDGVDLSRDDFYRRLESDDILPKTSQPSPAVFEEMFARIRDNGQEGLVITLSSVLSGTYESARLAAENYPEIYVVDSKSVTIGTGILVEHALACAERGMSLAELAKEVETMRERICVLAKLNTLEYLVRGGRVSKTAGFAGGLLNVKPVITIEEGAVQILGKARGPKKANAFLIEQIEESGIDYDLPILLGYTGTSDALLRDYIDNSRNLWEGFVDELDCAQICSVIGTHAGPGVVAVAFFKA